MATTSRSIRYQAHLNATVILEKFVNEDWIATDQRGQQSKTKDKTLVIVFPESYQVRVIGVSKKVDHWCEIMEQALNGVPYNELSYSRHMEDFLDPLIVKGTRGYIESVVGQINRSFKAEAFDGSAVLIRRLVETLVIELFEAKGIDNKIKNSSGDFFHLADLVSHAIAESDANTGVWNLSRNTKKALQDMKELGDLSAHSRRYLAKKTDITKVQSNLRVATEELLSLAGLK